MTELVSRITALLKTEGLSLTAYETVDSTNTVLKAAAEQGAAQGTVVLAQEQLGGKGTRGRRFFSPPGTGLYMSVLLRPCADARQALSITTTAAVAVCEAMERLSSRNPQIKWVNDVYCDGKKVCGILTESSLDPQTGKPLYTVLGIGINVSEPHGGFPPELAQTATSVFGTGEGDRAALAAAVLDAFFARYATLGAAEHTQAYRERSMLDGRTVTVSSSAGEREATVLGIDNACRLCVRFTDGEEAALSYGDVTLHRE